MMNITTNELVGTITETALRIKALEDENEALVDRGTDTVVHGGLFAKPAGERTPLLPKHIHEAYRILQVFNLLLIY